MRDRNLSFIQFTEEMENQSKRKLAQVSKIFRKPVLDSPTREIVDLKVSLRTSKLFALRGLAVLTFYLPEEIGWLIRMELWEKERFYNLQDRMSLKLLTDSKEVALTYLFETKSLTSHEIFGNLLQEGLKALQRTEFLWIERRKPKELVRRRGYKDKGSLRPYEKWLPTSDWSLTQQQNEIERRKLSHSRLYSRLKDYLQERYLFYLEESPE